MKTIKRVRIFLAATAATALLAGAGVGSAAVDSSADEPERAAPAIAGEATDASPNAWQSNDCALLLDVFGEGAQAYGC